MQLQVEVQRASRHPGPRDRQIRHWVRRVLNTEPTQDAPRVRLCVRMMDRAEMAALNLRHRRRRGSTNVLSFPATGPEAGGWRHLGDVAACAPVIEDEARTLGREPEAHWAHLLVHGVLHLQGYTHEAEREAREMETRETAILRELGFPAPYL